MPPKPPKFGAEPTPFPSTKPSAEGSHNSGKTHGISGFGAGIPLPWVTSLTLYLKSLLPQVQDMSSRVKDWLERSMITSMALHLSSTIWSSADRSLQEEFPSGGDQDAQGTEGLWNRARRSCYLPRVVTRPSAGAPSLEIPIPAFFRWGFAPNLERTGPEAPHEPLERCSSSRCFPDGIWVCFPRFWEKRRTPGRGRDRKWS